MASTRCWRKVYGSGQMSSCNSPNNVNCGVYCASSKLQCAKVALEMTSIVAAIFAAITGGVQLFKGMDMAGVTKYVDDLGPTSFVKIASPSQLDDILRLGAKAETSAMSGMFRTFVMGMYGAMSYIVGVEPTCKLKKVMLHIISYILN